MDTAGGQIRGMRPLSTTWPESSRTMRKLRGGSEGPPSRVLPYRRRASEFMYTKGRGPSPDLVEAYKWLSLSVEGLQGTERAEAVGYRDQLAKRLTPVQIAQAERLARNWRPKDRWGSPYSLGYPLGGVPAGEASAVAAEQAIDMESYSLRAPLGEDWRLMSDPIPGDSDVHERPSQRRTRMDSCRSERPSS